MLKRIMPTADGAIAQTGASALVYCSDAEPGIARRRAGKGFWYVDARGRTVDDPATLARIKALAIPPAWRDVWISPRAEGHLQATGRDDRGRKQYRYHALWTACRDEVKYASLTAFARTLPQLRRQVDADLRRQGLTRERVIASAVWLLDNSLIRVGNPAYARDNKSFGLTTLRQRHLTVEGATLRFAFRGKSGKEWKLKLADRRIARIIKSVQDLPGQHLFQYVDEEGQRRTITSQDVNDYIRGAGGSDFSSKHFRTWGGTVRAATLFESATLPDSGRERAVAMNRIIDQVAARLGNTRAVCRNCYIHPLVLSAWSEGTLGEGLARARRGRTGKGLEKDEACVLRWLERAERAQARKRP